MLVKVTTNLLIYLSPKTWNVVKANRYLITLFYWIVSEVRDIAQSFNEYKNDFHSRMTLWEFLKQNMASAAKKFLLGSHETIEK